jgi:hypothetical protein
MTRIITFIFLISINLLKGQNTIEWDGIYQLKLSDFQSSTTQVGKGNIYSIYPAATMAFSFFMTNAEFMFTKNFNSKVNCSFNPAASSLIAPDSSTAADLVNFARYYFDLSELYARKFRKKLYEEKGVFSDINFFKPIYDGIQKEFSERYIIAGTQSDMGRNKEKLNELHQEVLKEINQLADFCKMCKPPKKKK